MIMRWYSDILSMSYKMNRSSMVVVDYWPLDRHVKEDISIVIGQTMTNIYPPVVKIIQIKLSLQRTIVPPTQRTANVLRQKTRSHMSHVLSTKLFSASIQSWSVMVMQPVIILKMRS